MYMSLSASVTALWIKCGETTTRHTPPLVGSVTRQVESMAASSATRSTEKESSAREASSFRRGRSSVCLVRCIDYIYPNSIRRLCDVVFSLLFGTRDSLELNDSLRKSSSLYVRRTTGIYSMFSSMADEFSCTSSAKGEEA